MRWRIRWRGIACERPLPLAVGYRAVHRGYFDRGASVIKEALKLNLGCRTRGRVGWVNVDCDPHPGVDVVADVSDLSRYADGSVSEIVASHVVEHFPHPQTLSVLKEWARVLEPGGTLYIAVPDFKRAVELYGKGGLNEWLVNFLMGDQPYKTAFHFNLFDEPRLKKMLKEAGFSDAYRVEFFEDAEPGECSSLISTADGLSVSLNLVATK